MNKEKKELTVYKEKKYEDYDIPEEDINNLKKVNMTLKSNLFYIIVLMFIILLLLLSLFIPKIIKKIHNKNLLDTYEEISKNEGLGELNIIDKEIISNEENFITGNFNGNLIQNAKNNSLNNGKIAYDEDNVYCIFENGNESGIIIFDKKTGTEKYRKTLMSGYELYNLNIMDNNLVFTAMGASTNGLENSFIIFYDLKSETLSYIENLFDSGIINIINSMHVTNNGIYFSTIDNNNLKFLNLKKHNITNVCQFKSDALISIDVFPKMLNIDEESNIYIMDSSGISKININDNEKEVLASNATSTNINPIIYNGDAYYFIENNIYKNNEVIYISKDNISAINIINNKVFFAQSNKLYSLNINSNINPELVTSFNCIINDIYVTDYCLILNYEDPIFINLN